MAEYIKRESAIAIIEEKQKELCPVGRYGRSYVYGLDREKYDAWEEIIDALGNIPSADVAPVVHAKWVSINSYNGGERRIATCSHCKNCGEVRTMRTEFGLWRNNSPYCPNCGATMDGGDDDEAD